jgi:hypothetical protein
MAMQFSKSAVIEKNTTAISACDASIRRLDGMLGLTVSKNAVRLAQLSRAANERTQLRSVNGQLRAAGTTVRPMADNVAQELMDLADKLDRQIAKDAIINASITFVTAVLDDVNRLRNITSSHQG